MLWVTLRYHDADAALGWLRAVGFVEQEVHRSAEDATVIEHAELTWPGGGGVMLSTHRESPHWPAQPGQGATFVATDDVDAMFRAAISAGGTALLEPTDQDYGMRTATLRDAEGNLWSFGSSTEQ